MAVLQGTGFPSHPLDNESHCCPLCEGFELLLCFPLAMSLPPQLLQSGLRSRRGGPNLFNNDLHGWDVSFSPLKSLGEGFSGKIFPFLEKEEKILSHRDVNGKDRQAQTHVFSSDNKISSSKNLSLTESSTSTDNEMEKFLLSFLPMPFYPLTQGNGV